MASLEMRDRLYDPVETLQEILEHAWRAVCQPYDVTAELPDLKILFEGADLGTPDQASQAVVANMLTEVIGCVGRFSPWYTPPARAFGLIRVQDRRSQSPCWALAPEAVHQWEKIRLPLSTAVAHRGGLIKALILLDEGMAEAFAEAAYALAACDCSPPKLFRIKACILEQAGVRCGCCGQPFRLVNG